MLAVLLSCTYSFEEYRSLEAILPPLSTSQISVLNVTMEKDCDVKLREFADSASGLSDEFAFDEKATKRLIRKIDLALLPLLSLLYLYVIAVFVSLSQWLTTLQFELPRPVCGNTSSAFSLG